MRLIVDINHPAHVHYFKNFIWEMEEKGHNVLITASQKEITYNLLDMYGFNYIKMGSYGNNIFTKLMNIPIMDFKMLNAVKEFQPDFLLGFGSIRAAHASKLMGKVCINLEDTEHSKWENRAYIPFIDAVLTPNCFMGDLGKKQIRYNGYTELAYLHPNYFTPNPSVLNEIGLSKGDSFIILRFVGWTASHDVGQHGIQNKVELVRELEKYGRVLITSEDKLEKDLEKYKANISPEKIHDLLYYTSLYLGEGATMATEAALLGTPSIYISSLVGTMGNLNELQGDYGLLYCYDDTKEALLKAVELIRAPDVKVEWHRKREKLLEEKIDVTAFMVWLIENYPESCKEIRKNPLWQDKFK